MPYKPATPCSHPGCPKLCHGRFCEAHTKEEYNRYNQYGRDPGSNKRYGRAWKQIRSTFLAANPLCEVCNADGRLTPATLAHHKVKLTDGGTNGWDNLQALCAGCHSRLHGQQGDYF